MKKLIATRSIKTASKHYQEGDKFEMEDIHADPLIACGAAVLAPADPVPQAPAKPPKSPKAKAEGLLGSSVLPSIIEIKGEKVQLGTIVTGAHKESGLSVEEWNALADADREAKLADYLAKLQGDGE